MACYCQIEYVRSDYDVGTPCSAVAASNSRSQCGFVRCWPVLSSHFSLGLAPHVGHRTARIFFGLDCFVVTSGEFVQFLAKLVKTVVPVSVGFNLFCADSVQSACVI